MSHTEYMLRNSGFCLFIFFWVELHGVLDVPVHPVTNRIVDQFKATMQQIGMLGSPYSN